MLKHKNIGKYIKDSVNILKMSVNISAAMRSITWFYSLTFRSYFCMDGAYRHKNGMLFAHFIRFLTNERLSKGNSKCPFNKLRIFRKI